MRCEYNGPETEADQIVFWDGDKPQGGVSQEPLRVDDIFGEVFRRYGKNFDGCWITDEYQLWLELIL